MGLELGFFVPPVPPAQFIKMALRAEEVGYDFITCDDHMIYPFGAPVGLSVRSGHSTSPGKNTQDAWKKKGRRSGSSGPCGLSPV